MVIRSTKAPAKKRVARTNRQRDAAAAAAAADSQTDEASSLTQSQSQSQQQTEPAADEPTAASLDDDGKTEPRVRKLAPSKRQPPPLPHSSPSILRTPLSSRLFPQSAAAAGLAGSAEDDPIIKRLNFGLKEAPTPGRSESIARQKQGQPLLVYCRVRPLSEEEHATAQAEGRDVEAACVQVDGLTGVNCIAPKVSRHTEQQPYCTHAPTRSRHSLYHRHHAGGCVAVCVQDSHCFGSGESSARFQFSGVFGPSAEQSEVFARSTQPLLEDSIAKGQNTLVFAYGLTKSGKTFTMFGQDGEQQGIIPRAVHAVFDKVSAAAMADNTDTAGVSSSLHSPSSSLLSPASRPSNPAVLVSFLEIYNDKLRDLLTKEKGDKAGRCELHNCSADGTENGEVYVKGLREVEVKSRQEAFTLLKQGQRLRQKAKTELNADSSRSHAVFTLKLLDEAGHVWCRLSIVDLAGSERTNRTKTQAGDERRKEASNINQSLVVLGRCLEALRSNNKNKKQQLVPYRDSTLTRLFKDSLSGWGRTVMIVNVSQVHADYDETVLALKYASIAKEVTIVAKVDAQLDVRELKRKHRLKQLHDKEASKRMEEEEDDDDDCDEPDDDSDVSVDDELPAADDEQLPVTIHQQQQAINKRDDSREEECFELTEAVYVLKQENVALRTEKAQQEQQLREQYTAEMEKQAEEAEGRAKKSVEDERQRMAKLMEAKFRLREQQMEEAAAELEDRLTQLQSDVAQRTEAATAMEKESAASLQKSEQARQQLHQQLEQSEARRQTERQRDDEQRQRLTERLQAAQAEVRAVRGELQAARQAGEEEKAALLVQLATAEAEVAALKALLAAAEADKVAAIEQLTAAIDEAAAEQTEREKREKRERKERESEDRLREKELSKERGEWEKARKAAERERSKREKEAEAMQADVETRMQRLQAELDSAVARLDSSRTEWQQRADEHRQQLSGAQAEAREQRAVHQRALEAVEKEKEAQLAATVAWMKGEHEKQTAALQSEIEQCTARLEQLDEQRRDAERRRQADAAARVNEEAARQDDEQRREQTRAEQQQRLLLLEQFEALREQHNAKEAKALPMPAFVALVQSLLDKRTEPAADSRPSIRPASAAAQPVEAPAVPTAAAVVPQPAAVVVLVPAAAAAAAVAVAAPAAASLPAAPSAPPAKPARTRKGSKASKRDSMDDFYDGYDERLVSAAIAHASSADSSHSSLSGGGGGVTSGLAAFAKKAKARLSSATDSLRFNSSRTAPASSLHHALNESKAAAIIASAAAATVESATSAAAANHRVLLSPQVQRALKASSSSASRRSRSKSRKGKENDEAAADPFDFDTALTAAATDGSSKPNKTAKKKREQELLAAALNKTSTPAPLSDAAHFDRLAMGDSNTAAVPPAGKYGRQQPQLGSSSSSSSSIVAPELPMKPKMAQPAPTPVAKRTRQHTGSR